MAAYAYTAINADGLELNGEVHAPTAEAAREQLRLRGLLADILEELPAGVGGARAAFRGGSAEGEAGREEDLRGFRKGVKARSLQGFSRQFATKIDAGP